MASVDLESYQGSQLKVGLWWISLAWFNKANNESFQSFSHHTVGRNAVAPIALTIGFISMFTKLEYNADVTFHLSHITLLVASYHDQFYRDGIYLVLTNMEGIPSVY